MHYASQAELCSRGKSRTPDPKAGRLRWTGGQKDRRTEAAPCTKFLKDFTTPPETRGLHISSNPECVRSV